MTEAEILEAYRLAFLAANPGKDLPKITYRGNGWYSVEGREKRRLKDIAEWTDRLNARHSSPVTLP
jgi:hypothetical protein